MTTFELADTLGAIFDKLSNELSAAATPMQVDHAVERTRDAVFTMVQLYVSQSRTMRSSWLDQLMQKEVASEDACSEDAE